MLSVRLEQHGEPGSVLAVTELADPEPGPQEVLVRMRARPVNPADLLVVRGLYGTLPDLPASPGLEGMGVVEAVGAEVDGLEVGQRVIPLGVWGTWQELIVAPGAQVIPVPDEVSDEAAAQFVVNPITAWVMTTEELALERGDWLLQTAAGSTLGRLVLQVARLRGFRTINVVRRSAQVQELIDLGADEVIATDTDDIVERVMAITRDEGVPGAIDAVGGATGGAAASALGQGGVLLSYGMLSQELLPIDASAMVFRGTTIRGFWVSEWFGRAGAERMQEVSGELLDLMGREEIVPPVEATYDLGEVEAACAHAERQGRQGKVLLTS